MAKFVFIHDRTQRIMTTVEAKTYDEAFDKYEEYVDKDFDDIDWRFDNADEMYDLFNDEYHSDEELRKLAREQNVSTVLTLEEAMNNA